MVISPDLAQKIVDDLRLIIKHKVNFMDTTGHIIASNDANRINAFHGGAAHVLKQKKTLLITYDGQYEGSRKGINMPIFFENNIIGVIGVSGGAEVEKYTEIVKAMTEILIKEAYLNVMTFQKREKHRLIIETLILNAGKLAQDTLFGINILDEYQVAVGSPLLADFDLSYLHPLLESILSNHEKIFFTLSHSFIIVLAPKKNLNHLLKNIQEKTFQKHKMAINFGVGLTVYKNEEFTMSYNTAKQALNWTKSSEIFQQIIYFKNLDLGMIVETLDVDIRQLYIDNVLQKLNARDLQLFCKIIKSFAKHNGSLAACSQELYIHKNTLQYQLNKIKDSTGYDPRNYHDFAVLYLALLLNDYSEVSS